MGGCRRQLVGQVSVGKRRRFWLIAAGSPDSVTCPVAPAGNGLGCARPRRFTITALRSFAFVATSLLTSAVVMAALATTPAHAQNATWSANPAAGDNFNDPGNWVPNVVPGSQTNTGTASFGPTAPNGVSPLIFSSVTLNQFQFLNGAPSYSIGVFSGTLNLVGGGVFNSSGMHQVIVVLPGGTLQFDNNSTAGDNTIGYSNRGGAIVFNNGSTAGSAGFENQSGGTINFINSNAGNSVIYLDSTKTREAVG
jgi:hypothetical protein